MDEGVDPTHMCRSLVDKVARSEQLMAVAQPDVLALFEDWLEELEEELLAAVRSAGTQDPQILSLALGVSHAGTRFLLAKLRREGKLPG